MSNLRNKYIIDAVRGQIPIDIEWVQEIINTSEMKRLQNIRQLGYSALDFPCATHNRFSHSLGTYSLARKIVKELGMKNKQDINELLAAALLHDIGHGPLSHTFEGIFNVDHEEMTCKIILDKNTNINKILSKHHINSTNVVKILRHRHKTKYLNDIISSQIDVDRLDYLTRDSHYTGACYGLVDCDILISWMMIKNNKICFSEKAVNSIENFLLGRYHMYAQVYEQPKTIYFENIIKKILYRFKELFRQKKVTDRFNISHFFLPWLNNKQWSVEQYLKLDDSVFNMFITQLNYEDDYEIKALLCVINNWNKKNVILKKDISANSAKKQTYDEQIININIKKIYDKQKQPIYIYDNIQKKLCNLDKFSNQIKLISDINHKTRLLCKYKI